LAFLAVLAVACASAAAFTSPASAAAAPAAAPSGAITSSIPCTVGGVASTCTLTVTSFQVINGVLTAVGTVSGGTTSVPFQAPVQATGSCQILDLTLGPLDLNLLGLVVHLDTVHLNITAQKGPGNLLGNLLCAVANLLNNQGGSNTTALQQIANLLTQIIARL
jgi:hypothetical protein